MTGFQIDPQFKADAIELGMLNGQVLLLMNNALVPWFIILPVTDEIELFKLPEVQRRVLNRNIDLLSGFIIDHFKADKLNVASIGNVVKQMHIHVIGRQVDDYCWPGVVWGRNEKVLYEEQDVHRIIKSISDAWGDEFTSRDV